MSSPLPLNGTASGSEFAFGYAVGGGMEYAVARQWTVKLEYLYYDLGTDRDKGTVTADFPAPLSMTVSAPFRGQIVRGGVNYRF